MKFPVMSPAIRSVLLSVVFGMMAAALLHERGVVDLNFGFPSESFEEGALMALTGGLGGYALLMAFRLLRALTNRARGE